MRLDGKNRIVVKIGSSSIVDTQSKSILADRVASIAEDIAWLSGELDKEVILMSSGALAWGRICMEAASIEPGDQESPQVAGACGQIGIASAWASACQDKGMAIGQLLLIPGQVTLPSVRAAILSMFRNSVIPYINENIPAMTVYDNDGLAAEVVRGLECDALVLLSDVDGVYTSNPMMNPNAVLIPQIDDIDEAISRFGGDVSSAIGTGGMVTKLHAAKTLSETGIETIIASGEGLNPLRSVVEGASGTVVRAK